MCSELREILLFYFYLLILSATLTLAASTLRNSCGPSNGTWLNQLPYWREKGNKANNAFDKNAATQCLFAKNVYVIGISTARQYSFSLQQLLGGESVTRAEQKKLCPKNSTEGHGLSSCKREIGGTNIKYLFFHYLDGFNYTSRGGFPFLKLKPFNKILPNDANEAIRMYSKEKEIYGSDWCNIYNGNVRQCLENFFNGSQSSDILIFNVGLAYTADVSKVVDFEGWLRASAVAFMKNIIETFRGNFVFRIPITQTHEDWFYQTSNHAKGNVILADAFGESSCKTNDTVMGKVKYGHQQWHFIDQWAINEGRSSLYTDRIHFEGPLTDAGVQRILNIICPGVGVDKHIPDDLPTQIELAGNCVVVNKTTTSNYSNSSSIVSDTLSEMDRQKQYYIVEPSGMLHVLPPLHAHNETASSHVAAYMLQKCPQMIPLSPEQFSFLPVASKVFPDIFTDRTLIRTHKDKWVKIVINKVLYLLTRKDFSTHGLDFEAVITISKWQESFLQYGGQFHSGLLLPH